MGRKINGVTADVLVCFQTRPGIDPENIIEAGDAKVKADKEQKTLKPLEGDGKKGFYSLKLENGAVTELTIFNTTYTVKNEHKTKKESTPGAFPITVWRDVGNIDKWKGKQRALQLLGYYTGKVDYDYGEKTERAVLAFQADNKLRTDGQKGDVDSDKTKSELTKAVKNNQNDKKDIWLAYRTLVRFTRSPSVADPKAKEGDPQKEAPEVDNRGFAKGEACGIDDCYGPVVTMASNSDFRVKVIREFISNDAKLVAESDNSDLVSIVDADLPNEQQMNLKMKTKDPGPDPEKTEVKIKWCKDKDTKIVIAVLSIIVLPMITVNVQPYFVSIKKKGEASSVQPNFSKDQLSEVFEWANKIWYPYGIQFTYAEWEDKEVGLSVAGQVSNTGKGYRAEFKELVNQAGDPSKDKINVYVVKNLPKGKGFTNSPLVVPEKPYGIILMCHEEGVKRAGKVLAHELGHFLGLANNYPKTKSEKRSHADDDPDVKNQKKDIWTFRRLMDQQRPMAARPKDVWAHNVGHGNNDRGIMLSVRNLPVDKTDNECYNARERASLAKTGKINDKP